MEIANKEKEYYDSDHLVYSCQYHVVFCPKYRRKIFKSPYDEALKKKFYRIAEEYKFSIPELEIMPEYVHMIIDCNPKFGVYECVKKLKMTTATEMRDEFPELKSRLPTLWTRASFISSIGSVSLDSIHQYIESQKNK